MKITIPVKSCPECFRPLFSVNTAMGQMMRCEPCAIDWFPDVEIDLLEFDEDIQASA